MSEPWEIAAERVDFQLSYYRAEKRRCFTDGGDTLTGPDIDNAYATPGEPPTEPEFTTGVWSSYEIPGPETEVGEPPTVDDYVEKYIRMAIHEVVHEGLEWLIVDGKRWLNPHGNKDAMITDAVDRLVEALHATRAVQWGRKRKG